jgi:hypothetical protein
MGHCSIMELPCRYTLLQTYFYQVKQVFLKKSYKNYVQKIGKYIVNIGTIVHL